MALTITEPKGAEVAGIKADRRLYLTADKDEVVEVGDPRAAFLLAAEGTRIPTEYVGLLEAEEGDEPEPDTEKDEPEEPTPEPDENYTEIRVEQNGSWYTGYRDDEEVFKVQGEDAMKAAVAELEG